MPEKDILGPGLFLSHYSLETLSALFLIVLTRVTAMIVAAPGLGETTSPMLVRAGIAVGISIAILPVLQNQIIPAMNIALHLPLAIFLLILGEILSGLLIGLIARMICLSIAISMQIVGLFTGLASVLQPDPELGASSTAISHMASFLIPVIILSTGLYSFPVAAVIGSYKLLPPGHMPLYGDMARDLAMTVSQSFSLALQLATPFILIGTLWPAMLGVLNRLLPSIQVYMIAMPAQLLGGVLLLGLLIDVITHIWQERITDVLMTLPGLNSLIPPQ